MQHLLPFPRKAVLFVCIAIFERLVQNGERIFGSHNGVSGFWHRNSTCYKNIWTTFLFLPSSLNTYKFFIIDLPMTSFTKLFSPFSVHSPLPTHSPLCFFVLWHGVVEF